MRDAKKMAAMAAKLIVLGARYRWSFTAKAKAKLAKRIITVLAPMVAVIREEDRREKEAAVRVSEAQALDKLIESMRRQAKIQREKLRARKIARTNRNKALAPLLDQIADNLEKPPKTEAEVFRSHGFKPTPVEDD